MESIGSRVKLMQVELGLNNVELAQKLGVEKATVGKWKNHDAVPRGDTLIAIREKLGISDTWLVHGKGDMKVKPVMDDFTYAVATISKGLDDKAKERILHYMRYEAEKNAGQA